MSIFLSIMVMAVVGASMLNVYRSFRRENGNNRKLAVICGVIFCVVLFLLCCFSMNVHWPR